VNLDQKIRQHRALDHVLTRPSAGDAWHQLGHAVLAVLEEHPHRLLDEFSRETTDDSAARYGRCGTCGNVRDGVYCPTVTAVARELGIDLAAVTG